MMVQISSQTLLCLLHLVHRENVIRPLMSTRCRLTMCCIYMKHKKILKIMVNIIDNFLSVPHQELGLE